MEISNVTPQPLGTGGGGQKPPPNSTELIKDKPVETDTVTLSDDVAVLSGTGGGGQKPPPNNNL